ncbi:hypothetical protein HZA39_04735 [Candidatus Peregrinibacteria bacterium]|nr:hypothetical protein [Candidatus Peregrinibacteria bacterium]
MKWIDFEREIKAKNIKLFTPFDIQRFLGRTKIAARFLIHRLKKQGYILGLKRGLYQLSDEYVPDLYLANKLYEPSYVSLEFALSYHQVIPETVYEITSVTTKATRSFPALGKLFTYRSIKKEAFTGYVSKKQDGVNYLIAEPEKAFVDYIYLRIRAGEEPLRRFDKEKINLDKALHWAELFDNYKLIGVIKKMFR